MAKKKTETSKGVIRGLIAKAWEAAKGLPRKLRGTKADVESAERKRIAKETDRSQKQIKDIEKGKRPGKNLFEPLQRMKRGQKAEAPPKDEKKITRKKGEKPEKPPEELPKKEKPKEQAPPTRRIKVTLRGEMGPYDDDDYIRQRTIRVELTADQTARFLDAWDRGERMEALGIATGAYFNPFAGHIESLDDEPEWEDIEESEAQ